jgi:putative membrane protein
LKSKIELINKETLMSRTLKDYLALAYKGAAMGMANTMPGVSGATIAYIMGIYDELISSIEALSFENIKGLFRKGIISYWKSINGSFLLFLLIGLFISIFILAKVINYLLIKFPIPVWAFFFGLIVSSAIYLATKNKSWNFKSFISIFFGVGITVLVSYISPVANTKDPEYWYVFLSAVISIFALILPRISGSLLLLIMGQYQFILSAVDNLRMNFLLIFGFGSIFGLITFSNAFSWILRKFYNTTICFLVGVMIGSLNKVWPWKHTLLSHSNQFAQIIPDKQENVLPFSYFELTAKDPQLLYAILMIIAGILTIFLLESSYSKAKTIEVSKSAY